jgi:transposase
MAKKSVSNWESIVEESTRGVKIWVGVDVHKTKYAVAVLSDTVVSHYFSAPADNDSLIRQFNSRGIIITALAYEAGLSGFGLYRACEKAGIKALAAAASRIPRPAAQSAKTDKIDCQKLAEYLSIGLLKPIAVPTEEQEAIRTKTRRRNQLAREVAMTKQRIKSFLIAHGLPEPPGLEGWSRAGVEELKKLQMLADLRFTLDSHLRQLEFFEEEKRLLEKEINAKVIPQDDVLQTVPGVGPVTAAIFRTEIFAPERFQRSEQLASFIGLAPIISQSGSGNASTRLRPCGQHKLRSMLIEAAWILRGREKWAAEFFNGIVRRGGKPQKAITALARKLATILWKLWLDNRRYQSHYMPPADTAI